MCKINAAVVWPRLSHFVPLYMIDGVSRNPLAARAMIHENKMTTRSEYIWFLFYNKIKPTLEEESFMARYTGPAWKLSRRLGISLSGTGKELEKRPYAPGQHGPNQRKKLSEYGIAITRKTKTSSHVWSK